MRATRPPTPCCRARNRLAAHCLLALALLYGLCGCSPLPYLPPERLPYAELAAPYHQTQLKVSSTLDVLNLTHPPQNGVDPNAAGKTLLSQNDTMIALAGQSKNGLKTWVNMVVFDEYQMTARRKYFFCSDEQAAIAPTDPKHYLIPPRKGILFDCEFTLATEILTTPYATEQARQVAIVRWLAGQIKSDVRELTGGRDDPTRANELVSMAGMMMNQVFRGVLGELEKSPGLARNLGDKRGIEFPHISLNKGRIRMRLREDIAVVKIRVNLPMVPIRES